MSSNEFSRFQFVRVETRSVVRLVTICRPDRANSLNSQTLAELDAVVDATSRDDTIRLFAMTGEGQKVFCAGADLTEATSENSNSKRAKAYDQRWDSLTNRIAALPCVTAALLNGPCIGGGLSLALAFDFRLAAQHAYFRYPVAKHGFMPSPADLQRLVSVAGSALARKLFLLGEPIPMPVALARGLADDLVEDGEAWQSLDKLAGFVTEGQLRSQLAIKRLIAAEEKFDQVADECYRAVYDFDQQALEDLRSNWPDLLSGRSLRGS